MQPLHRASALVPGVATGIGSLPYSEPRAAAVAVLRCLPDLPAAPQLPRRDPREGAAAQWLGALPEVDVAVDGAITASAPSAEAPRCDFRTGAHDGLLAFVEVLREQEQPPPRVKAQVTGPLTLGLALVGAGIAPTRAFRRAGDAVRAWMVALEELLAEQLPSSEVLLVLDEPALARWRGGGSPPLEREAAIDLLSGALAAPGCATGVHVCGDGDLQLAIEAGPQVLGLEVREELVRDAAAISRFLEGDGWIAWGAVPTDRPVGESIEPHWRRLAHVWCELTRRGCDPLLLRMHGMITPACGLAGYGASQAERLLGIARQLAGRVHDQAVAARLMLGA